MALSESIRTYRKGREMNQEALFHEDIWDALRDCVMALQREFIQSAKAMRAILARMARSGLVVPE